ncbi:MAG: ABC transporter substrate-binding protein [Elusimicrobia bacterium]|nr:ABC transporter substrate-binding protein [Elusimicrobiota bacterium]
MSCDVVLKKLAAPTLCLLIVFPWPPAAWSRGGIPALVEIHPSLDIDSFDPAWANDSLSRSVLLNVYEPLVSLKGNSLSELEPRLSAKVPARSNGLLSADGLRYTFPIRKGVRFHDGSRLTCEDVRYSILRFALLDRPAGGPSFHLLAPLAGVLKTRDDAGTIQVDFKDVASRVVCEGDSFKIALQKPYAPLLQVLAQYGLVVSKQWAVRRGDWDGRAETWPKFRDAKKEDSAFFGRTNGTGPYELAQWDKVSKSVRLRRNQGYWRTPADIEQVLLKEVPDASVRRMMIAAGDAQISEETGAQSATQWDGIPGARTIRLSVPRTDAFFFTYEIDASGNPALFSGRLDGEGIPPDFFADKDVRQGFSRAFDRKAYLDEALGSLGVPASGFLPSELLGRPAGVAASARDPAEARRHFERAWKGELWRKGFRLAVYYNTGNAARQAACEILKRDLESINPRFKVEVRSLSWASYLAAMRRKKLPLFLIGYTAASADPDDFASAFLHSQGLYPRLQGLKVPRWDLMVETAAHEGKPEARRTLYRRLEREAMDEAAQVYIAHPQTLKIVRDDVTIRVMNPMSPGTDFYELAWRQSKVAVTVTRR